MEASIVLVALPQADGLVKRRPALVLREMRPFGDLLLAGISTKLHQAVPEFDELLLAGDPDFVASGLSAPSVVRLGYLAAVARAKVVGRMGELPAARHRAMLARLGAYLVAAG